MQFQRRSSAFKRQILPILLTKSHFQPSMDAKTCIEEEESKTFKDGGSRQFDY